MAEPNSEPALTPTIRLLPDSNEPAEANTAVPAWIWTPPEKLLFPLTTTSPEPVLMKAPAPEIGPLSVEAWELLELNVRLCPPLLIAPESVRLPWAFVTAKVALLPKAIESWIVPLVAARVTADAVAGASVMLLPASTKPGEARVIESNEVPVARLFWVEIWAAP